MKNEIPITYVIAANTPSYYKQINKKDGTIVIHASNPYIGISRTPNTTAHVTDKNWGAVTDHRPIVFRVKAKLKLKDVRKRIAKSMFMSPMQWSRQSTHTSVARRES